MKRREGPSKIRLQTLLLLCNSSILLLLILILSVFAYWNSRRLVLEKAFQYQNQKMENLENYLSFYMQYIENTALAISQNPEVTGAFLKDAPPNVIEEREERELLKSILASTANAGANIFSINIVDSLYGFYPRGMINDLYYQSDIPSDLAEGAFLSRDAGWVSAPGGEFLKFQGTTNQNFLHYYKNIRYRNGSTRVATVVVTLRGDALLKPFGTDYAQGNLLILEDGGRVAAGGGPFGPGSIYTGELRTDPAAPGQRELVLTKKLAPSGWTLVYKADANQAAAGTGQILKNLVLLGLPVLALSMLASGFLSYKISRPVRRLVKNMQNAEQTGFAANQEHTRIYELSWLSGRYNQLLERISLLIQKNRREQENKRRGELKLLQAQINPHFIYNIIELINWSAQKNQVPEISDMVCHLGRMLRIALNRGEEVLAIGQELKHVESYLELERFKYENSFTVHWDLQEGIETGYTIKLILQPLVENCIFHGFSHMEEGGEILITGRLDGGDVRFFIEDNGRGMSEEEMAGILLRDSGGYGAHNVDERIRMRFGPGYGLRYYRPQHPGQGVEVVIPFITDPALLEEENADGAGDLFD